MVVALTATTSQSRGHHQSGEGEESLKRFFIVGPCSKGGDGLFEAILALAVDLRAVCSTYSGVLLARPR